MKKFLTLVLTGALVVALTAAVTPAQANAAPYLSKSAAKRKAKKEVRALYNGVVTDAESAEDVPSDWYVGGCYRVSRNKVECDFEISYDDGMICTDSIRIIKKWWGLTFRYPYEIDCSY